MVKNCVLKAVGTPAKQALLQNREESFLYKHGVLVTKQICCHSEDSSLVQ